MSADLGGALRSGLKRVRGDSALGRTERRLRADIAALAARLDGTAPSGEPVGRTEPDGAFARSDASIRALFDPPRPWLVPEAVALVEEHLTTEMTMLEWGGGSSTPFWCERVGVLHTVEASPGWAAILLDYMAGRPDLVDRWRMHFVGANWASTRSSKRRTGRSMPSPEIRERLEDDYALVLSDRVDVIVVDGSARQRTVRRLADYVDRDAPALIVVDNLEASYVADPVLELDLSAYERHNYWGTQTDLAGVSSPECTTVWMRSPA